MHADIDAIAYLYNFAKKEIQYKNYFINIWMLLKLYNLVLEKKWGGIFRPYAMKIRFLTSVQ